jgi:CheY-like chemotaxis protein
MKRERILLIDDRDEVRDAVACSLAQAGSLVEAVRDPAEAIDSLTAARPNWILVAEWQAPDLLTRLRHETHVRDIPVVLLPDLKVPPRRAAIVAAANDPESSF